ncbi:MAG: hypothetical protein K2X86_00735 [Cytophagaceae bacterium]|nr:hypothetical protein [Cytophagaceae bacterium]
MKEIKWFTKVFLMKTAKFKTNIDSEARVKSLLDSYPLIKEWKLDINDPDKTLIVSGYSFSKEDIIKVIQEEGYMIQPK